MTFQWLISIHLEFLDLASCEAINRTTARADALKPLARTVSIHARLYHCRWSLDNAENPPIRRPTSCKIQLIQFVFLWSITRYCLPLTNCETRNVPTTVLSLRLLNARKQPFWLSEPHFNVTNCKCTYMCVLEAGVTSLWDMLHIFEWQWCQIDITLW